MGRLYKGFCTRCGYSAEFPLGAGMMSANLMRNIKCLSEIEQTIVKDLYETEVIQSFTIENKLVLCSNCKKLKAQTIITIHQKSGQTEVFGQYCGQCGNDIYIYEGKNGEVKEEVQCPRCKENILKITPSGLWD